MKKIINIICVLFLILTTNSCEGQEKKRTKESPPKLEKTEQSTDSLPINFLDKKFQQGGFFLPDNSPSYPSYSYLENKIGVFSISYVGKNFKAEYFWNVQNKEGFFSKKKSPENAAADSKNIQKAINQDDYYIIADFLPSKYVAFLNGHDGEFEPKENAVTSFYLYESNKWVLLEKINTKKIPGNIFQYYIKLIQTHKLQNSSIPQQYHGNFSINIGIEATTNGMASIIYNFTISKDKIILKENTYHEPIRCEGEYKSIEKNGILELYYSGENEDCFSIEPFFYIKNKDGKYFVKGIGGEGTINEWLEMTKDNR